MPITPRGGGPVRSSSGADPQTVVLSGTWQPQAGDRLIIVSGNDYYALSNLTTPTVGGSTAGVTAITAGTADAGTNQAHVKTYYYNVGGTGNLTVSVDESGPGDEEKFLGVWVLPGTDLTAAPIGNGGSF
jgi:hypothetical protein